MAILRAYLMDCASKVAMSASITRRATLPLNLYSEGSQMLLVKWQAHPGQGLGCVLYTTRRQVLFGHLCLAALLADTRTVQPISQDSIPVVTDSIFSLAAYTEPVSPIIESSPSERSQQPEPSAMT